MLTVLTGAALSIAQACSDDDVRPPTTSNPGGSAGSGPGGGGSTPSPGPLPIGQDQNPEAGGTTGPDAAVGTVPGVPGPDAGTGTGFDDGGGVTETDSGMIIIVQ